MKGWLALAIGMGMVLMLAGCGRGGKDREEVAGATSPFDSGPRAAEAPVNEAQAALGETLFRSKTCSSCHAFGARITGPDLAGVTHRRSAEWMEEQILHPERMAKNDPISRSLLRQYAQQMPNLMLQPEEARALIEFTKRKDRELAATGKLPSR